MFCISFGGSRRSQAVSTAVAVLLPRAPRRYNTHGDHLEADRLALIHPGTQNRDEVAQILGSPSSTSVFGDEAWYYISDVVETRSIFSRKVTERQVVTIRFDDQGVVKELDMFGLDRGKEVELVERETPSFGKSTNFFTDLLGNLGRFNRNDTQPQRR